MPWPGAGVSFAAVFSSGADGLVHLAGDEFVDRAGAGLGLVTDRDGDLAAGHAGVGLAGAEAARIGYRGARQAHGLGGVDLGVR